MYFGIPDDLIRPALERKLAKYYALPVIITTAQALSNVK
jgi:hypothetical protein